MPTKKQREANRRAFKKMNTKEKISYVFAYYKLPIFTAFAVAAFIISLIVYNVIKKDPVLYTAYANIEVSDTLNQLLTDGYIETSGKNPKRQKVLVYRDLYITDDETGADHDYAYASKMKIIGAISAKQLDVVLMNKDAYDLMSSSGFLLDLEASKEINPQFYQTMSPYFEKNTVIVSDNSVEYSLNQADTYESVTEDFSNGVNVSSFAPFRNAGFDGEVYAGIIATTKHLDEAFSFIAWLPDAEAAGAEQ